MQKKQTRILSALLAIMVSGTAQAALIDRGSGLIYDDVLDVTWLQDANYAFTSGYTAANAVNNGFSATDNIFVDGRMGWTAANTWADALSYAGYDDWRLPTFTGGTTCSGYDCDDSELAVMFYENMGASARSSILSGTNTANLAMIDNLQHYVYWSGVEYAPTPANAWSFDTRIGNQNDRNQRTELYAWAVRSGDVTGSAPTPSVPTPVPLWLIGSGLIGLLGWKRKR